MYKIAYIVFSAGLLAASTVSFAAWPEKPIKLIVPFAPGGSASTSARLAAHRLSDVLGQQVIVENMGGANGGIAAAAALRAPADGYTFFYSSAGIMTVNPTLYPNLPYAVKNFTPVSLTSTFASLLYVNANFPANNIAELVNLESMQKANSSPEAKRLHADGATFISKIKMFTTEEQTIIELDEAKSS